jgi:hypothetical protein
VSSKPETTFTMSINRQGILKETYFEKMHNPFRAGTADYWYSGAVGDLWVEYKYEPSLPKIKEYRPDLSPRQEKWLGDRYADGRNIAVILGLPEGGVIYTHKSWLFAFTKAELMTRCVPRPQIAEWIFEQVGASPCKKLSELLPQPRS